jgi:flagellar FliJ protein
VTRGKRLEPVHGLAVEAERSAAQRLADAERVAAEALERLTQLEHYEREYRTTLQQRVAEGIGATGLRDYQAFLARLGEALTQQRSVLAKAVAGRGAAREQWLASSTRRRAVGKVIEQAVAAERRDAERREQRDLDERALRAFNRPHPDDDPGRGHG